MSIDSDTLDPTFLNNDELQTNFIEKLDTFSKYYSKEDLKIMRILDTMENFDQYNYASSLSQLSNCILDYDILPPDIFELQILASVFDLDINLLEVNITNNNAIVTNYKFKTYKSLTLNDDTEQKKNYFV
jgi:hypothetical protein